MAEDGSAFDTDLARLASVNLNLLVPLLALLEERSVTRAADAVGVSQPAMSHALRRMRRLLGDELLVRQGATMSLTPRATSLIAPLQRVLQQTARIVSAGPFDPADDRRVITVAMTTSTALVMGGAFARLVAERAPNAVLRLRTATITSTAMVTEEGADVVLLSEALPSPHPRERLYDDRWVVITNSSAPKDADALELLTTLPHVVFEAAPLRLRPYQVLDAEGIAYTVRRHTSDNLLVPELISAAGGVALHRYRVAAAMSRHLDLRIEEFPFPVQSVGMDLVWNPWLADDEFKLWLRGLLFEAAG
ncbi:LysR family transcriptional regulator [Georgenia daeguensis]|uniref:LysR family transcriptional regulator n=1 Tax=Georgenia daeguensis TaxID=908355 RepID=A0ABP8EY01_9MICO